jgi:hypothetical protein
MYTEFFKNQINDMAIYGNVVHQFVFNRIVFFEFFFGSVVSSLLILSVLNFYGQKGITFSIVR